MDYLILIGGGLLALYIAFRVLRFLFRLIVGTVNWLRLLLKKPRWAFLVLFNRPRLKQEMRQTRIDALIASGMPPHLAAARVDAPPGYRMPRPLDLDRMELDEFYMELDKRNDESLDHMSGNPMYDTVLHDMVNYDYDLKGM